MICHEVLDRDSYGPPHKEAEVLALAYAPRERFVIVRRGGGLLRFDASEWERIDIPVVFLHAQMTRCGFGFTRRGAIRSMNRCADTGLRW